MASGDEAEWFDVWITADWRFSGIRKQRAIRYPGLPRNYGAIQDERGGCFWTPDWHTSEAEAVSQVRSEISRIVEYHEMKIRENQDEIESLRSYDYAVR